MKRSPAPAGAASAAKAPPTKSPASMLDDSLRNAAVIDKGGYAYIVHPLLDGVPRADPALLASWCDWAAAQPGLDGATLLLAPEAMGLPLLAALSLRTGIPYGIVRKRAYGRPGERAVPARTGYGAATLHVNDVGPHDRVVVVDDVLSTGGTIEALLTTLKATGATVTAALVFVDKGTAAAGLTTRHQVPIHAMRRIRVTPAGVTLLP